MKIRHITQYLFESFKDARSKFSREASEDEVKQYLDTFKQLTNKGTVSGQEKDIGYWIKQGWTEFKYFVDSKSQEKSKSQVKKGKKQNSIIAHDDDEYFMVIPLTREASCYYGKNTEWCTSATESENQFPHYFYINKEPLMYIYKKDTKEKFAVRFSTGKDKIIDMYNENDDSISDKDFPKKTGISIEYVEKLFSENLSTIQKAQEIKNLSDETLIDTIHHIPNIIRNVDNPSEEVQLAAVETNPFSIRYINNPTEDVQIKAVSTQAGAIKYIENPSTKVIEEAIRTNSFDAIKNLDNSIIDEDLMWRTLKIEPRTIDLFDHIDGLPTQEMVDYVFQYHPLHALDYYKNITEEMVWKVLKQEPNYIDEIYRKSKHKFPTQEMAEYVFQHRPDIAVRYLDNPTPEQQMDAIEANPLSIKRIDNSHPKVQVAALKKDPNLIERIPNPSEEAIDYIIELGEIPFISKLFANSTVDPEKIDEETKKRIRQVMGME